MHGRAKQDTARQSMARQGTVRRGTAGRGTARHGKTSAATWYGKVRQSSKNDFADNHIKFQSKSRNYSLASLPHRKNAYLCRDVVGSNEGYRNLMMLTSRSFTEGMYYKPRIDEELLRMYCGGLICLSACLAGQLPQLLLANKTQEAEELVLRYREIFGAENYYIELQDHGIPEQKQVAPLLI